jgi:hypothetical protein
MEFMNVQQLNKLGIKAFRPHRVRVRAKAGQKAETKTVMQPSYEGTKELLKKMVRLGWVDILGRQLSWQHWQRRAETARAKSAQAAQTAVCRACYIKCGRGATGSPS